MRAVTAIARVTFREALRDRVLYLFLGFAIVLLAVSKLFGMLTVGDEGKVIEDLGLAGIQFFSMLIAVMMSVLLISREVERRTVYTVLTTPVRRWQFLLGKYLGLLLTVAANLLLMTVVLIAVAALYQGELEPMLLFGGVMTLLEMALVAAFAVLFSVVTRPILGSVMTFAVFVVGHVSEDIWLLTAHLRGGGIVATVLYYLVPNLEWFNFKAEIVHDLAVSPAMVGWALVYGASYTAVVLLLACLWIERRDFE